MNSMEQVRDQPAYVLHSRPYKETSALVDYLTADHGRIRLVAKGVRRQKSRLRGVLQPFVPLVISWQGRGELKNLVDAELQSAPVFWQGRSLWCGLYLNELLTRTLNFGEPMPRLFAYYQLALNSLDDPQSQEPLLRIFESKLLMELGFALCFSQSLDAQGSPQPVIAERNYLWNPEQGFMDAELEPEAPSYPGAVLLAMEADDYQTAEVRRFSKRLMRAALAPHLGRQPLLSRQLFQQQNTPKKPVDTDQ